jgi:2-(3-amino-3-carboxypropyl)histidine synthase
MKSLFISAKCKFLLFFNSINFSLLPKNIGLISTIQFVDYLPKLKEVLENKGKKVFVYSNPLILGCNALAAKKIQNKVDAFLFLGSGDFHVLHTSNKITKPIFQFNPINMEFKEFDRSKTEKIKIKESILEKKFILSKKIGILITVKPGQNNIKEALKIKKQILLSKKFKNKEIFMFVFNNLDLNQFENFPDIPIYINTACPGIMLDSDKIINLEQVKRILNKEK